LYIFSVLLLFFFFFQAEDGIRDFHVTGVQTCALPIWRSAHEAYIFKILIDEVIKLIATIKGLYRNGIFSVFTVFLLDFGTFALNDLLSFFFTHRIVYQAQNTIGHIIHTNEEAY